MRSTGPALAAAFVVLAGAVAAAGSPRDIDGSPARVEVLERIDAEIRTAPTPRAAEDRLPSLLARLAGFTDDEVSLLTEWKPKPPLPPDRAHVHPWLCRAMQFLRGPGRELRQRDRLAVLFGSPRETDWAEACVRLGHEPFGEGLRRAVVALHRDARADVRFGAGAIASLMAAHTGPSAALDAIALNLLVDEDPAVAKAFALRHAYNFESVVVLDKVVARLADERVCPSRASPLFSTGTTPVSWGMNQSLQANLVAWRESWWPAGILPSKETWSDGAAVQRWWKDVRPRWSFEPCPSKWRRVLDGSVVARIGEPARLTPVDGSAAWTVLLKKYREFTTSEPRCASFLAFESGEPDPARRFSTGFGAPLASLAEPHITGGGESSEHIFVVSCARVGDSEEVRMRVRHWRRR